MTAPPRRDIGEILLEERLLTEGVLRAVRRMAKRERMPVVVVLLSEGHLREDQILDLLVRRLKLPMVSPAKLLIDDDVLRLIPYDLAERHRVLPLALDIDPQTGAGTLRVVMADPLDREAREELERITGHHINPVLAPATALATTIRQRYRGVVSKMADGKDEHTPPTGVALLRAGGQRKHDNTVTQPLAHIDDEAPIELRLRALIAVLCDAGVITERAYAEAIQRLLRGSESGGQ